MAEQTTLSNLGEAMGGVAARRRRAAPAKPKLDAKGRAYATGRRKNAIARVWVKRGGGKITVNGKAIDDLFRPPGAADARPAADGSGDCAATRSMSNAPSSVAGCPARLAPCVTVLSRALTHFEPELRPVLKKNGFLTRDPRAVERKKYGRAKARRSFQFSKR